MAPTLRLALPTKSLSPRARNTRTANDNYAADAGGGSRTFIGSETWRAALLGTVAAGAVMFGYARRAYAQVTPPNAPCNQISGGGTTVTCTGDVSTGVSLVNGNGPYTTLNVNNLATSITPASGVYGIEFTSSAAGGVTINSNTGAFGIATTNADGIYAYAQGGAITIDSTGDIASNGGGGIDVFRNGGLSAISVTSVGNIVSTFTGIRVSTGQSTGSVTVNSTGNIASAYSDGINVANEGYGNVSVTSSGNIAAGDDGIYARAQYDAVTVNSTGNVAAGGDGIYARSAGTGAVSVTNHGNVAAYSDAISAKSGTGAVTVDSTGDLASTTGRGIYAANAGAGAISVTNQGNIKTYSTGIRAASIGGAGTVTVNSTGDITVSGPNLSAILASTDGASAVSVTSTGNLTATRYGIFVVSAGGNATIESTGNVSGTQAAIRVDAPGANGAATLRSGTIYGGGDGVLFVGGTTNKLTNYASISGGNFAVRGGTGNETVNNYGIITGNVDLGAGTNTFDNRAGATFNSGATANLGAGNTLTNAGDLSPGRVGIVQTTALTGNIVQTGTGTFTVDVAGASADRVNATGTATLAGTVAVNVASAPTVPEYIILTAAGGVTDLGLTLGPTSPLLHASLLFPDAFTVVLGLTVEFDLDGLNRNERGSGEVPRWVLRRRHRRPQPGSHGPAQCRRPCRLQARARSAAARDLFRRADRLALCPPRLRQQPVELPRQRHGYRLHHPRGAMPVGRRQRRLPRYRLHLPAARLQ